MLSQLGKICLEGKAWDQLHPIHTRSQQGKGCTPAPPGCGCMYQVNRVQVLLFQWRKGIQAGKVFLAKYLLFPTDRSACEGTEGQLIAAHAQDSTCRLDTTDTLEAS